MAVKLEIDEQQARFLIFSMCIMLVEVDIDFPDMADRLFPDSDNQDRELQKRCIDLAKQIKALRKQLPKLGVNPIKYPDTFDHEMLKAKYWRDLVTEMHDDSRIG